MEKLSSVLFWDIDMNEADMDKYPAHFIQRVLEYGNREEVEEICRFYGSAIVREIASNPQRFRLYDHVRRNSRYIKEDKYETAL